MTLKSAIIIGGGLGGLSAAIKLQASGVQTTILEKNDYLGGKLHLETLGSHTFDFGPNTITMPQVFLDVLSLTGEDPANYLSFYKLITHTKNQFQDGSSFCFSSEKKIMEEELEKISPGSSKDYSNYLKEVTRLYQLAEHHFFHRTFQSWSNYLSPRLGLAMTRARPLETMDHFHRRFFKDERIIQSLNRYATYIGSSPYHAPATFAMMGYLELVEGVYMAKGGNVSIASAFLKAAIKLGVEIVYNTEIAHTEIENRKIKTVITDDNRTFSADTFILNGDLLSQYPRLVSEENRPKFQNKKRNNLEPSISAYVILAANNKTLPVHHHHLLFSKDPKREFKQLFDQKSYAEDPTIYICTSSKTEASLSPSGDNHFILVNAPALPTGQHSMEESEMFLDSYKKLIYDKISAAGYEIKNNLLADKSIDPTRIKQKFNAYRGSLYGISSNNLKNTFLRPMNRSQDVENLYFTGGSTHPGGGSPMVVLSGQNVANQILINRQ